MVEEFDPNLVFVNLGDIDRFGHSRRHRHHRARRRAARRSPTPTCRWAASSTCCKSIRPLGATRCVIVLADHSMDWSLPHQVDQPAAALDADPLLAGKVQIAENGGADLLYWTGPDGQRDAAIARMRRIATAQPGVLAAHDRQPTRPWLRLGARGRRRGGLLQGGLAVQRPASRPRNPIPGNHGHPATRPIPFFLGGGHPAVPRRADLLGPGPHRGRRAHGRAVLRARRPRGGYDGRSRL